jgi:hypothetical protein
VLCPKATRAIPAESSSAIALFHVRFSEPHRLNGVSAYGASRSASMNRLVLARIPDDGSRVRDSWPNAAFASESILAPLEGLTCAD